MRAMTHDAAGTRTTTDCLAARQEGGPWLTAASTRAVVIGVVTSAYAVFLAFSIVTLAAPLRFSIGLSVPAAGRARIEWLLPGGRLWDAGIRSGDQVLALDRRPPQPRDNGMWAGTQLRVRTESGDTLTAKARLLPNDRTTWPLLLLSPWFLLLGTLVFLRARQPEVGWAIYLLFGSASLAFAVTPMTYSDVPAASVSEFVLVLFFAAAFAHFFLIFPTLRGSRYLHAAAVAPPLLLVPFGVAAFVWPALYEPVSSLRLVVLLLALCLGVGLLVRALFTEGDETIRWGLIVISTGTALAVLPFVGLYLAPMVLGQSPLLAPELAIPALAIMPAAFAYAILRHKTLGVPLLQRWFVHGLVWAALIVAYTAPTFVVRQLTNSLLPEPARSLVLTALLIVLINVSCRRLHDQLWPRLDRRLFKDRYDYRASLLSLSRDLSLADDLSGFSTSLPDALRRLMNLDFAALLIREAGRPCVRGTAGDCRPEVLAALVQAAAAQADNRLLRSVSANSGHVLLMPLHMNKALVGHLCLGPKLSGEPFGTADTALLTTLGGHLSAMVRNAQLVDDLRAKVAALAALNDRLHRVQEEERACLVADIHDEPLQTAIYLHRQLASAKPSDPALQALVLLSRTLVHQLRAICSAIRPPVLDDLGLSTALDVLALELGNRANVPILLEIEAELAAATLPRAVDLVLYRAAQEALNNCLRHGHPTIVRVELRREGHLLYLSVADDGKGFVVPPHLDRPALSAHIGLAGLSTRVQRAGGRLLVTSTPGTGSLVQVELPVEGVTA